MRHRSGPPRARWTLALWLGYWAVLFIATHRPLDAGVGLIPPGGDKVIHAVIYLVLVVLGGRHMRSGGRRPTVARLLAWAGIYVVYGGFDEWLQGFVQRTPSVWDWVADVAGVVAGTFAIAWDERSDGRSQRDGRSD